MRRLSRPHLDYLDGVRALAALFVVVNHAWSLAYWDGVSGQPHRGAPLGVLMFGHFAVSVFIVVSGFCLMLPLADGGQLDKRAFFARRARRILGPYYLALLLALLLATTLLKGPTGTVWDQSVPVTWGGLWAHLLLVQDFAHSAQLNPALWSIATEWQIYFLFPLLIVLFRRSARQALLSASLLAFLAIVAGLAVLPRQVGSIAPQYLVLFAGGMFAAHVCFSPQAERLRRAPWRLLAAVGFASFWALVALAGPLLVLTAGIVVDLLVGATTLAVLVAACPTVRERSRLRALLSCSPLAGVGRFAYSIYLIHTPLLVLVWHYGLAPYHLSTGLSCVLIEASIPFLLAPCYLFYRSCELPFFRKDGLGWPALMVTRLRTLVIAGA